MYVSSSSTVVLPRASSSSLIVGVLVEIVKESERCWCLRFDVRITALIPIQFVTSEVAFGGEAKGDAPETICLAVIGT